MNNYLVCEMKKSKVNFGIHCEIYSSLSIKAVSPPFWKTMKYWNILANSISKYHEILNSEILWNVALLSSKLSLLLTQAASLSIFTLWKARRKFELYGKSFPTKICLSDAWARSIFLDSIAVSVVVVILVSLTNLRRAGLSISFHQLML